MCGAARRVGTTAVIEDNELGSLFLKLVDVLSHEAF